VIYAVTFFIAFLLSIFLLPFTTKASEKWNVFSKTRGGIKGKPCLGGIGIYAAFLLSFLSVSFFEVPFDSRFFGLMVSSGIIVLLGVMDDVKDLRPLVKIAVELVAIASLVLFGIVTKLALLPVWVNILITLLWVLFITNAFNLLDIADGLTSGLVVIISLTLLVISLVNGDIFSSMILLALAGAHLGFLRYNYPPARLYMGDTGSLFSGFLLAAVAINISYAPLERPVALVTPILAMSLPIYDTLFLIIMRMRKKKPIFSKTGDHFALRLMTLGYSPSKSLWIMYAFSIFLAFSSLVVAFGSNLVGILAILGALLVFVFMGKRAGMVRVE